jgi:hypothetical protein
VAIGRNDAAAGNRMLVFGGSCRGARSLSAYHGDFTLAHSDMIEF